MSNNVSWLTELAIKPGELDNMKALMAEMIEATMANEPDTLNYDWHLNDAVDSCHIYERYSDSAAVLVHLANFGAKFADRFLGCMDFNRLTVYGNASDDVRATLDGFGATYYPSSTGFVR